jgi:hypothetical protein
MRWSTAALLLALAPACSKTPVKALPEARAQATPAAAPTPAPRQTTFGKTTAGPALRPSEILAHLDQYDGKLVRVEGTVAAVCPHRGCWMDVAGQDGARIRIKVTDGEIVFPVAAQGKRVIAEGKVVKIPADPADDRAACGGEGEPKGQVASGHEECARPAGAGARIDGSGAIVFEES